jgi:KUP system potassium uptake protein
MRADNDGEGGIMALIALVQGVSLKGRWTKWALVALGIFGASLFYGDGMITPAISVLSAVEGLKVAAPSLEHLVIPITLAIITLLFAIQRFGTGAVGRLFGPVMGLWFAVLAVSGLGEVAARPEILKALSPTYAIEFFADHPGTAFIALGSVVLAVTGAEALYADMGHFGRSPIRRAWFLFVFPALTLNYLGQGALILNSRKAIDNPFFLLIPHWGRIPMVLLATVATVIASQAVISGAFSVTRQAVQLGFLPRVTIRHTSHREEGQVYAPGINTGLFVAVVALVVGFGSSQNLASAYGIAVTGTLAIDTILFFVVVRMLWRKPTWLVALGAAVFLTVDLAFFAANLPKVVHGGWFPLMVAAVVFAVLITWQRGREIVTRNRIEEEGPLDTFVEEVRAMDPPLYRSPGTGVFLNANRETTPLALRALCEHTRVLPEAVVIISIESLKVPHHPPEERCSIDDLGYEDDGISHVTARFGFQDEPNVPATLRQAAKDGLESRLDVENPSYFLSQITIHPSDESNLARWRKRLFMGISRNSASPVEYFGLPDDRTVTIGAHIEL